MDQQHDPYQPGTYYRDSHATFRVDSHEPDPAFGHDKLVKVTNLKTGRQYQWTSRSFPREPSTWTRLDPQEEQFERAVDANPLDSTTHHAFADWHDEHGNHDEAAFRRAMGNWLDTGPPIGSYFRDAGPPEEPDNPQAWPIHLEMGSWIDLSKPEGVTRFPFTHEDDYGGPHPTSVDTTQPHGQWEISWEENHPVWIEYVVDEDHDNGIRGRMAWPNYRAMEQSFRESFMKNRRLRMSRKAGAFGAMLKMFGA